MKILVFLVMLISILSGCKQKNISQNLNNFQIQEETGWISKNLRQSKDILEKAVPKSKNTFYLWKGFKNAKITYEDGKVINLKISYYGGFFYVVEYQRFFQIPEKIIIEWQELIGIKKI